MNKYILFSIFTLFINCNKNEIKQIKAAVISARQEASDIGLNIIAKGGNAFDAMIATDLALSVCYPNAGNIAGGGFLVYRTTDGKFGSLDYREKAPEQATRDMYLDSDGNVISGKSTIGGLAVGIPGTIAGLYEIHKKFGTMPWKDLVQPAINLAKNGYKVTNKQKRSFDSKKEDFIKINGKNTFYENRVTKVKLINNRSKLNQFAFHVSNPVIIFFRNLCLKILIKNKKFLENYLGKIYKN